MDGTAPLVTAFLIGPFGPIKWLWPTKFSKSLGLILSASGTRGTSNFFYYKYNSILMVECL
jgi:hypothetical protein